MLALLTNSAAAQSQTRAADQAQRRTATGNLVGHGGPVKAIAVSEDGTRVLTGSFDYSAILWDITSEPPKIIHRLTDHNAAVNAVAFVNGTTRALTAGDDSLVRLWDLATGKLIHKFEGHDAGSKIVGLSVARHWAVSAGWDRTVRLWDLNALLAGPVMTGPAPVNAAVFGSGQFQFPVIYTASYDGVIRAYSDRGTVVRDVVKLGQSVNVLLALPRGAVAEGFSGHHSGKPPEPSLLFGTVSGEAGIINAETGHRERELPEAARPILALATEHRAVKSNFAVASGDGRVRVFSDNNLNFIEEYRHPFGPVWAVALVPKTGDNPQRLYYAGLDDFVSLWQVAPRKPFEPVDSSQYPRRFQQSAASSDDPVSKGEIQFARKCSICHTLTPDSANRAGPTLHNIFGRKIATLPGYNFSPELKTLDIVWNAATIAKLFELGPDKFTPGSKMPLQVMSDKTERDALISFLEVATK